MKKTEHSLDSQNLSEGPVPAHPQRKPKTKRRDFKIEVYKAWCKACGICVAFCPSHVFVKDEEGYPRVAHSEACIGCGWCEVHCPDFAITVHGEGTRKKKE